MNEPNENKTLDWQAELYERIGQHPEYMIIFDLILREKNKSYEIGKLHANKEELK